MNLFRRNADPPPADAVIVTVAAEFARDTGIADSRIVLSMEAIAAAFSANPFDSLHRVTPS
jgi:hypothetical protein